VKGEPDADDKKRKKPAKAQPQSQWSGIANQMLASGVAGPKSSNGGR
jgi:hypothetical protein